MSLKKQFEPDFEAFIGVKNPRQLAEVLDIDYRYLMRTVYGDVNRTKYAIFTIKKKSGGERQIEAPYLWLKNIQRRLASVLLQGYKPKSTTHGFAKKKGIKSNASVHLKRRCIVNIDLQEFFPSIHFGRVKGMFMNHPFYFNKELSELLSTIACYNKRLPQGSPCSPIISNYIARPLDNALGKLAAKNKCNYSRYVDDISFSTNLSSLPAELGSIINGRLILSEAFVTIIKEHGFQINEKKTRYAMRTNRQDVTGLIVNEKLNVRRDYVKHVRLLLHNWERHTLPKAANHYYQHYAINQSLITDIQDRYAKMLTSKIGFIGYIKGKDNSVYTALANRLLELHPSAALTTLIKEVKNEDKVLVFGEGKTDWKHLTAAYRALKMENTYKLPDVKIRDYDYSSEINNSSLLDICAALSKADVYKNIVICVFDSDDKSIVRKAANEGKSFKYWGNNVYSVVLPSPPNSSDHICIEQYYSEAEIKTIDNHGRRLFLSSEFDKVTGKHNTDELTYNKINKLKKSEYTFIIDNEVVNEAGENRALTKNSFASNILNREIGFRQFNFQNFKLLFNLIRQIIENHQK